MAGSRNAIGGMKSAQRSRIGNGTDVLPGIDGRSPSARRYKELLDQFIADMGGNPSEAKRTIAKRAATLVIWCETVEGMAVEGVKDLDIAAFTTACNTLRRLLADLGLERKARDITPTLKDYAAQNYGGQSA